MSAQAIDDGEIVGKDPKSRPRPQAGRRAAQAGSRIAFIELHVGGAVQRVTLKRTAQARRFTLRVSAARRVVVLTMPSHGSLPAARAFAQRHAGWIAEKLDVLVPRVPFAAEAAIPLRGRPHRVVSRPGLRCRVWVEDGIGNDEPLLCVSAPESKFAATLGRFLHAEAKRDLTEAAARHAAAAGKPIRRLTLRDTRSRWGSCSAQGTINFSWRLIFAPPFVLDYLAAHEVAHLVHMNHSAAFWAVARRLAPRIDEAEAWLKQHGASLHTYGR